MGGLDLLKQYPVVSRVGFSMVNLAKPDFLWDAIGKSRAATRERIRIQVQVLAEAADWTA